MDVTLLPYGNVRKAEATSGNETGKPECQHGPAECRYNRLLGCAIKKLPKQEDFIPFVACAEKMIGTSANGGQDGNPKIAAILSQCSPTATVTAAINACGGSKEAAAIFEENGKLTHLLKTKYVPWVVINGEVSELASSDLKKAICTVLDTRDQPAFCRVPDMILKAEPRKVPPGICMKGLTSEEDHDFRMHLARQEKARAARSSINASSASAGNVVEMIEEEYRKYRDGLVLRGGVADSVASRPRRENIQATDSHTEEQNSQPHQHGDPWGEAAPAVPRRKQKRRSDGTEKMHGQGMLLRREETDGGTSKL